MRVVLLGTGTLVPEADRRATGLLVQVDEMVAPVDLGRGVLDRMVEAGIDPCAIGRFFFTHLHPDHSADLVSLLFALRHGREAGAPVRFHGPPGLGSLIERIGEAWPSARPESPVEVHETGGGLLVDGPLRVWAGPVHHGDRPALGYRIKDATTGRSMAFTGDSGPGPDLDRLVSGVDLLVAECGDGLAPRRGRHLDVDSFVDLARRSGAARVVVTHLDPRGDRPAVVAALREALAERLIVGEDLLELRV